MPELASLSHEPEDVRAHFERAQADGDALAALDDAELDYYAY